MHIVFMYNTRKCTAHSHDVYIHSTMKENYVCMYTTIYIHVLGIYCHWHPLYVLIHVNIIHSTVHVTNNLLNCLGTQESVSSRVCWVACVCACHNFRGLQLIMQLASIIDT